MSSLARRQRPGHVSGEITRGTTNPNRLRRVDRWLTSTVLPKLHPSPHIIDLGFGAHPVTTVEMFTRARAVSSEVSVTGLEISPERVAAAKQFERPGLAFSHGGFEIPGTIPVQVIRAFNVLRQYPETVVHQHWAQMASRLSPDGIIIDGTCDEVGRKASWITLDPTGPQTLSISMRFAAFTQPSDIAERLPKALIHHNIPGTAIYNYLQQLDQYWAESAALSSFGSRQRFVAICARAKKAGWPIRGNTSRWRLGEITVGYDAVAPSDFVSFS